MREMMIPAKYTLKFDPSTDAYNGKNINIPLPSSLSLIQSWTKGCRQIQGNKLNRFFYEMFYG